MQHGSFSTGQMLEAVTQTTFIKFRAVLYCILFWQEIVKVMGNIFGTWMIFCHIIPGTNPSKTPDLGHLYL